MMTEHTQLTSRALQRLRIANIPQWMAYNPKRALQRVIRAAVGPVKADDGTLRPASSASQRRAPDN